MSNRLLTSPLALALFAWSALAGAAPVGVADAPVEAAADDRSAVAVDAPAPEAQERFDIWEYRIEGNSKLPQESVERLVYPFLGPQRVFDDVEAARSALEDAYREAGYGTALVTIPLQEVNQGVVRLEVTEGRVSRLRVVGSRYFSLGRIREKVPALAEGQAPNLSEAQKQLADLNALSPDRSITPVLRAGRTPGTVEVDLKVEDRSPLHGEIEVNDRFAADTTRTRLNASVRYDNLWQREHSIGLSYQVSPENRNEVEVFAGTYVFKIPDTDKVVALYGVNSNTDIASVGTLGVIGTGIIVGGRLIVPLAATTPESFFHSATFGVDYKDFDESINRLGADTTLAPISYHRFSAGYNGGFRTEAHETGWGVEMAFGMRGLGNEEAEFANKRFKGQPNYLFFKGKFDHRHTLWRGFSAALRVATQAAMSPLISNEQFAAGGALSVRGYTESQRLGDDGVALQMELRSPRLVPEAWATYIRKLHVYAFTDGAWLRVQDALPAEPESYDLSSAGLGVEGEVLGGVDFVVEWAHAFATSVSAASGAGDGDGNTVSSNGDVRSGDDRIHFKVGYQF
jgi:hemolysin activation/secretion protein